MSDSDWTTANQRVLVAEFARLRARLEEKGHDEAARNLEEVRSAVAMPTAIDLLTETFGLTAFERDTLLLCAGMTMDESFAQACMARAPRSSRIQPTFGLALAVLADAHWSALTPIGALRAMRLLRVHDEHALTTCRISIEERVLHYLAGVNYLDPALKSFVEPAEVELLAPSHAVVAEQAEDALRTGTSTPLIQLIGDDADGKVQVATRIAQNCGLRLRCLQVQDLPIGTDQLDDLASLWNRDSALLGSALLLCIQEESEPRIAARFVKRLSGLTFVSSPIEFDLPRAAVFDVSRRDRSSKSGCGIRRWANPRAASVERSIRSPGNFTWVAETSRGWRARCAARP